MIKRPYKHPYADADACAGILFEEYKKQGRLSIAFDFDNILFDYYDVRKDVSEVISLLQECDEYNFTMILFTNSKNSGLEFCMRFCEENDIRVDYVNENPMFSTIKPYYNLLLDDKAGIGCAIRTLDKLIQLLYEDIHIWQTL